MLITFLAVTLLSFMTLFLGTYAADRLESRRCSGCGQGLEQPGRPTMH